MREALRNAGVGVVEIVCDEDADASRFARALRELQGAGGADATAIAPDAARSLSHALRTPLSAMAGWVHLIETGKLDEAGLKRAATKLRGNIDDQVKTIERYLGATRQEGRG